MISGSLQIKNEKFYTVIYLESKSGKKKQKWEATGLSVKGNYRKAEMLLRERIRKYEFEEGLLPDDTTLADYIRYWLTVIARTVEPNTYDGYKHNCEKHIIPYFEGKKYKLKTVTRAQIQRFIDEKLVSGRLDGKPGGLSPKTVREFRNILSAVFKEAIISNIIAVNPCEHIGLPSVPKTEPVFYTEAQVARLFDCIKTEEIFPVIYLCVVYGVRRSEVLGIKWDSIDFERKLITIRHTVVCYNKVYEKNTTKTQSSYRSYPMSEDIIDLVNKAKEREERNRRLFGKEYCENDYVFKWADGHPYSPDYITAKFRKLLKKNNLPLLRLHDLRHTCASLLIDKGFQIKDIQEWLGHASIQTTANIYGHLDVARKRTIADQMTAMFSEKKDNNENS